MNPNLLEIWQLRLGLVLLAVLCFVFGGLAARKGFEAVRTQKFDNLLEGHLASKYGAEAMFIGAFVFVFGFFLIYAAWKCL